MVSCKEIVEKANDYLDRHMPLPKRIGFRMHLFMCQHCNRYVKQLKITIKAIAHVQSSKCCDSDEAQKIVDILKNQNPNK